MTLLIVVIFFLIFTIFKSRKNDYQGLALQMARRERDRFEILKPCPLCGSMLKKGETLKTRIIEIGGTRSERPKGVQEHRAEIMGCPYCWPAQKEHPRFCPACKRKLEDQELIYARYFERQEKKNHLRVLGCSKCRNL